MITNGNYDGFGMMWHDAEAERVRFVKSTGSTEDKIKIYQENMDKGDLGIHVRHATHGDKNEENCHPYCVLSKDLGHKMDLYMMHNGTIPDVIVEKDMSDSFNFAKYFLRPFLEKRPELIHDKSFCYLLSGMIRDNNKLLFLDSKGRWAIINSSAGSKQKGVWVSTKMEIKDWMPNFQQAHQPTRTTSGTNTQQFGEQSLGRYPKNRGEWTMESDGRSHFIVRPQGKEIQDHPTKDDKEGHTPKSQASIQVSGLHLVSGGGRAGTSAAGTNSSFDARRAAWNPPHGFEAENFIPLGGFVVEPEDVAKMDKAEILQLVLESPFEISDLIFTAMRELITFKKQERIGRTA